MADMSASGADVRKDVGVQLSPSAQMDTKQYRQCSMTRKVETSTETHVAFLPTEFAKVGKTVGIKFGDEWREGFVIDSVGPSRELSDMDLGREDCKRFRWVLRK